MVAEDEQQLLIKVRFWGRRVPMGQSLGVLGGKKTLSQWVFNCPSHQHQKETTFLEGCFTKTPFLNIFVLILGPAPGPTETNVRKCLLPKYVSFPCLE